MHMYTWSDLAMEPVEGPFSKYMTPQETALLVALVKSVAPKVMIEFGCNRGATAKCILSNVLSLQKYIGIDVLPQHRPTLDCQLGEVSLWPGDLVKDNRFSLLLQSSFTLLPGELEPCDAVFIDGDHSERAVLHDSYLARSLVRPGGIIIWHDFGNPSVEVTEAIRRLYGEGWPISCVKDSWLAFMKTGD